MKKYFIIGLFALVFLTACSSSPGRYDTFAKCLSANNVTMYGTSWCPHCHAQEALFGNSFQYINFVDCDKHPGECGAANITGYPTWNINGTNYIGEQTFYDISKASGCIAG